MGACHSKGSATHSTKGRNYNEQQQSTQNKNSLRNPLIQGVQESKRKEYYYHINRASGTDTSSGKEIMVDSNAIKYENILVNVDLPEISGTEKQVEYAKNLLRRSINNQISRMQDQAKIWGTPEMKEKQRKQIDNLIAKVNQTYGTNAKTFSDVVNESIKRKGAFKFARDNPTAKAIIDKFA